MSPLPETTQSQVSRFMRLRRKHGFSRYLICLGTIVTLAAPLNASAKDVQVQASVVAVNVQKYGIRLGETRETRTPYSRMWWVKQCCMQLQHTERRSRACFKDEVTQPIKRNICPMIVAPANDG